MPAEKLGKHKTSVACLYVNKLSDVDLDVLRDLAAHHNTLTLSEVVRFGDTERGRAEAAASLALRSGDPAGGAAS